MSKLHNINTIHLLKDKPRAQSLVLPVQESDNTLTFLLLLAWDKNNLFLHKKINNNQQNPNHCLQKFHTKDRQHNSTLFLTANSPFNTGLTQNFTYFPRTSHQSNRILKEITKNDKMAMDAYPIRWLQWPPTAFPWIPHAQNAILRAWPELPFHILSSQYQIHFAPAMVTSSSHCS